jgi:hypothetical protein
VAFVLASVLGPTALHALTGEALWLAALALPILVGSGRIVEHLMAASDADLARVRAEVAAELKELGK